jgi:protoheme ferro-lyase
MSVQDLYASSIRAMSAAERLELATLILRDIPPQSLVDYRTEWSEEDLADLTKASWKSLEADGEYASDGENG